MGLLAENVNARLCEAGECNSNPSIKVPLLINHYYYYHSQLYVLCEILCKGRILPLPKPVLSLYPSCGPGIGFPRYA